MRTKRRRGLLDWIFPPERDFLGLIRKQADLAAEAAAALEAWIDGGDESLADRVRDIEHAGDEIRSTLGSWLAEVFHTPINREDLDRMSRSLDEVLDYLKTTVKEIRTFEITPDDVIREMVGTLRNGVDDLDLAVEHFEKDREAAAAYAIRAKKAENVLEAIYRKAVKALFREGNLQEIILRREVYRHLSNAGDRLDEAADQVWMAILKNA